MANNDAAQIQAKRMAHTAIRKPRRALVLGGAVVTDNEAEFTRVNSLRVENWLHPTAANL
jgi:predicted nucleic acid-binding protein